MTDDERIDMVLSEMAKNQDGKLAIQKYFFEVIRDVDHQAYKRVITSIEANGYVKKIPGKASIIYEIQPTGIEIVDSGGYIKYINKTKSDGEEAERLKKIVLEDSEVKLKLNKFYFKYRWLPFAFSTLALTISILVAIFK